MTRPSPSFVDSNARSAGAVEHFVTLFDDAFLPFGLALYQSLCRHGGAFQLWIICMDETVARHLERLSLPHLAVIGLDEIETPELKRVKSGRSRGEYCWTVTPFSFGAVFNRDSAVTRVTYVDADLFLFDDPRILLAELDSAGRGILVTEHAYAPQYDRSHDSGRFCVQFLTADRSDRAARILDWWQQRCLEWCYARYEDGKFGDQVYLDQWPELFGDDLHIVRQVEKTLAPWNVDYFSRNSSEALCPVFYHFHGLRLVSPNCARLFRFYRIGREGMRFYRAYLASLARSLEIMRSAGIPAAVHPLPPERFGVLQRTLRRLRGTERFARLPAVTE